MLECNTASESFDIRMSELRLVQFAFLCIQIRILSKIGTQNISFCPRPLRLHHIVFVLHFRIFKSSITRLSLKGVSKKESNLWIEIFIFEFRRPVELSYSFRIIHKVRYIIAIYYQNKLRLTSRVNIMQYFSYILPKVYVGHVTLNNLISYSTRVIRPESKSGILQN